MILLIYTYHVGGVLMSEERVNLNTTIRKDLKTKLQFRALKKGVYMNDLLEELLEKYFEGDTEDENN